MKASYTDKLNWLNDYLPFIKLNHDLIISHMKSANSCITLANTLDANASFYVSKKMADNITGENCTYNIILNIHIFQDQTNIDNLIYSLTITSAKPNFISEIYANISKYIEKIINKDDIIRFSDKEFLMINSQESKQIIEEILNKLILLFCYPTYYKEYDNFFNENANDDITLIAMASI